MILRAATAALALALGCKHSRPPVEFHSDAGAPTRVPDARAAGTGDARDTGDAGRFVPVDGVAVVGDGRSLMVGGVAIPAPDGQRFAVWLPVDLDGDGSAGDVLATLLQADGSALAAVAVYRRAGTGFNPVVLTGPEPADPRCTDTTLRLTSPRSAVVGYRCTSPGAADAGVQPHAPEYAQEQVVVALGPAPVVRYRVALLPGLSGSSLALRVEAVDRDGDGRDDVVVSLGAGAPGSPPRVEARVVLFDRAGGTARDVNEPAASLGAVVDGARRQVGRRRAGAVAAVAMLDDLTRLRRALCAEGGTARLRLGGALGVDCSGSQAAFTAGAEVLARAWLALGELPAAFAETRPQTAGVLGVASSERLLQDLGRAAVLERGVTARPGPFAAQPLDGVIPARTGVLALEPVAAPVALSLHGPATGRIELVTLTFAPGPPGEVRDVLPRAPDGSLAVVGFAETCTGVGAVLCPPSVPGCDQPLALASTALPPGSGFARFTSLPSAAMAARCVTAPGAVTVLPASAGARVLGWGRAGPVFGWRGEVFRVGAVGTGAGREATALGVAEPAGGGFGPGAAVSPEGGTLALAAPEGIWLRSRGQWHLWAPTALAGRTGQLTDVTVTEDGRTVAGLLGGQVWVLERPRGGR